MKFVLSGMLDNRWSGHLRVKSVIRVRLLGDIKFWQPRVGAQEMTVNMVKFGDILISRPAGREAFLAAKAYLFTENAGLDSIILDFKGVKVLAPSWGG